MTPAQLQAILAEKTRRLLADAITWDDGRFFYEAGRRGASRDADRRRRARSEDQRAVAVVVDLAAALEQIRREAADGAASDGADADGTDADGCLDIDDGDVVEAARTTPRRAARRRHRPAPLTAAARRF